jgi:hypothetical protein
MTPTTSTVAIAAAAANANLFLRTSFLKPIGRVRWTGEDGFVIEVPLDVTREAVGRFVAPGAIFLQISFSRWNWLLIVSSSLLYPHQWEIRGEKPSRWLHKYEALLPRQWDYSTKLGLQSRRAPGEVRAAFRPIIGAPCCDVT